MIKIDCQEYANQIISQVKRQVSNVVKRKELVILTAGDDPASESYMKGKMNDCKKCGIECYQVRVKSQKDLMTQISFANWSDKVGGIIVQLPLPEGFNEREAVNAVRIDKDVDGFKQGSPFLPCTPEGIMWVLNHELDGDLSGKTVLLIGKGKLIGKPLIDMLLERGCTLTIAHSKTKNLNRLVTYHHDVVITGVGKPNLIDLHWVNAEVVIDAGISRDENGKLCGDCCGFDPDDGRDMKVTTVPNGIGLMTRAMLMKHMGEVNKKW